MTNPAGALGLSWRRPPFISRRSAVGCRLSPYWRASGPSGLPCYSRAVKSDISWMSCRPMIRRWISLIPSPISRIGPLTKLADRSGVFLPLFLQDYSCSLSFRVYSKLTVGLRMMKRKSQPTVPAYVTTATHWRLVTEVVEKHPPPALRRGGVIQDRPQALHGRLAEPLRLRPIRARGANA